VLPDILGTGSLVGSLLVNNHLAAEATNNKADHDANSPTMTKLTIMNKLQIVMLMITLMSPKS
jgi:hypothetical protein